VAGTGTDKDGLADEARLAHIIADAHALGSPRVTMWWAPADSHDQLLRDADLYNSAGATLAAEGLKLCYHNHHHELTTSHNGVQALSILAERTDPALVSFEIDIAWATYAGEVPARLLARFVGRVPAIHVKDVQSLAEPPQFTAVGTGIVDMAASVAAATAAGVEWFVVEQDTLRNLSALDTAAIGALHLRELGL
jgi:sugar phosphate isomerase/epimerase